MNRYSFLIIVLLLSPIISYSQRNEVAKIRVNAGNHDRFNTIVSTSLEGINIDIANNKVALYEITKNGEVKVASQLEMSYAPILWWKLSRPLSAGKTVNYSLRREDSSLEEPLSKVQILDQDGNLTVNINGNNVLQYNFSEAPLPNGVSKVYNRAGYIHPLWSPKGEVLTRIQPPDHYHHVGIWNPWTHTKYKGRVIDFWNLNKVEGTVKPVSIISKTSNHIFGEFKVLHDHVDLNGVTPTGAEVALKEEWDVRVWNVSDDSWLIDFSSQLNCATDSALTIIKYRYQGFGFRATKKWNDKTANLLTSEGKNKEDGNSTRARWCDVNGVSELGTSGVLFITHPSNYNYPEPIRIWPVGANKGKENVFFNFNPSMDRDWVLEPGNNYQLKYRMFVYDGKIDKLQAERLWADFAHPPAVTIEILKIK